MYLKHKTMIKESFNYTEKQFEIDTLKKRQIVCKFSVFDSKIIESILLGFPIRKIICTSDRDGVITVVSDHNIIESVLRFIGGESLADCTFLSNYNGYTFNDLPYNIQSMFLSFKLDFYILSPITETSIIDYIIQQNK